jgi:Domain of unknown function (DUF4136)
MLGRRSATWLCVAMAVPVAIVLAGGCATTINHAYDPSANFGQLRRYAWGPGSPSYSPNSLVEAYVRTLADPLLEKKGFQRVTATPDLVISIRLDNYPSGPPGSYEVRFYPSDSGSYEVRFLDLSVYRTDGQTLMWRGTASGSISTDAASSDLRNAVQGILAAFPPG